MIKFGDHVTPTSSFFSNFQTNNHHDNQLQCFKYVLKL